VKPLGFGAIPTRLVGRTPLRISELGFGAAPLGNLYHPVSDADAEGALAAALEAGWAISIPRLFMASA
jgi:aryl-alcohol dehydrogenase-like predicted oxidoreductase